MIKVIVFDFWNTLGYKLYKLGRTKSIWEETGKKRSPRAFTKAFEKHFQLDKSKDFGKKYCNMLDELGVSYTEEFIKKHIRYRNRLEFKSRIHVYKYVIPLLRELSKKKYKIGVLSNTTYAKGSRIKKSKLSRYVNKFFFSYDIGLIKPVVRNFKAVLKYFKVKPSEALMIGDSYPDDIVPSRKLGMNAIHFHNGRQLKKELKERGIL